MGAERALSHPTVILRVNELQKVQFSELVQLIGGCAGIRKEYIEMQDSI